MRPARVGRERIDHRLGIAWAENSKGTIIDVRGDVLGALPHFQNAAEHRRRGRRHAPR